MALLTRDQVLGSDDLPTEMVKVPEWEDDDGNPGEMLLRGLTADQADEFGQSFIGPDGEVDTTGMRARLVSMCARNADGGRLFPEPGDAAALGKKSGAAMLRVFTVAQKLSGLGAATEDVVKN